MSIHIITPLLSESLDWTKIKPGYYMIKSHEDTILSKCYYNTSIWFKLQGLMGKKQLKSYDGILLKPCNSIHTFFMRMSIDVLFINKAGIITDIIPSMRPWRITLPSFKHYACIEMPANSSILFQYLKIGQKLSVLELDEDVIN